jgi:predicted anti-sigma-YlaC factor YlaD
MSTIRKAIKLLNMSCEDTAVLVSRGLDGELGRLERTTVRLHLLYCRACRRYRQNIVALRDIGQLEDETPTRLPDDARERIRSALRSSDS